MKGFTLIELLAVIVILAIILLIAVPTISNLIEGVKKDSFESSAKMMVKAADYYYLSKTVNGSIANKTFNYENGEAVGDELDFDGKKPESGTIIVRNDGKVALAIHDGIYCAKKDYDGQVIVDETEISACVIAEGGLWTGPFTFEVTIPAGGRTFSFGAVDANLTINWGDAVEETFTHTGPASITHAYGAGVYNVTVTGTSSHISFCSVDNFTGGVCTGTPALLSDILTPIPISMGLTSAHAMFADTTIESFTREDFFDQASANITSLSFMFFHNYSFNGKVNSWDTSNVTDMSHMFTANFSFNQPLNNFDTSNVTNFNAMFASAEIFNQDISNWDVSKATHMQSMFGGAYAFNQNISTWDVSGVEYMDAIFYIATSFNQDISNWDVSNMISMEEVFNYATSFNQDLSSWCVSKFATMPFYFDEDATSWLLPRPVWGTCP